MRTIMIVDDQVIDIMELEEALTANGYTIAGVAYSGKEAVTMATDRRPDLILMDIKMPGEMDGISAAEVIKAQTDIPIIFLTGHSSQKYINRAKRVDPSGYIMKPIHSDQIVATIEIALHNKTNRQTRRDPPIATRQLQASHPFFTKREIQISGLIIQGMDTAEMAVFLHASPDTISWHRKNIRKKLGLKGKKGSIKEILLKLV